jgi:hypothetical protein
MLMVRQAPLHRIGAMAGIASAVYLLVQARRISRRRQLPEGSPCVHVYQWHLIRQRDAMRGSAITIVLMALASALVSVTLDSGAWAVLGSVAAPVVGGSVAARHVLGYVRRADRLIAGLDALR